MNTVTTTQQNQIQGLGSEFLDNEKIELIKKHFFPQGANNTEIEYCFAIAKQYCLNPILKQIFFIKRRFKDANGEFINKVEPLVGRDGFLTLAHRTGKFAGITTTCELKEAPQFLNGEWKITKELVANCKVFRTDATQPFEVEVFFSEYVQKDRDGNITSFWAGKPVTMLKKVAESQCLRKAFDIAGVYAPEEVEGIQYQDDSYHDSSIENSIVEDTSYSLHKLSLIDVFNDLRSIGIKIGIVNQQIEVLEGNAIKVPKKMTDYGFKYINKKWVASLDRFNPITIKSLEILNKLENKQILYEIAMPNPNNLWFKVDAVNAIKNLPILEELGFSEKTDKNSSVVYVLKISSN